MYEVWLLRGQCRIQQGPSTATSREAVIWVEPAAETQSESSKAIVYLEGDVALSVNSEGKRATLADRSWLGRLSSFATVRVQPARVDAEPPEKPAIYQRALARWQPIPDGAVRRAQYQQPVPEVPAGTRRIRAFGRSDVPPSLNWFHDPVSNQWIGVIEGGVQFIVDGLPEYGSIDVSTDRMVVWTTSVSEPLQGGQSLQAEGQPLEIYMDGNIVFRQGERVIHASRMYYDVNRHAGTVLDAELLTPVPNYAGLLRLRTRILQQLDRDHFFAEDAALTSSRLGQPTYRLQVGNALFEDRQTPLIDPFSGMPQTDPETNAPVTDHQRFATATNNFLLVGDVPVFYWPYIATDLTDPTFYIRRARLKTDNVFGTQVITTWDMYHLLGIEHPPQGTDWDLSVDYLSQRGFGHGTTFTYQRPELFDLPGPASGLLDYWGIYDTGLDNLGPRRRSLTPEANYRFRLFGQHRQQLPDGFQLTAELGWLSDRNFMEEYFKREWDELKDYHTGLELKQYRDNTSWNASLDYSLNPFFTDTDWLPRLDHFWLGEPLGGVFTWFEHSSAGYAHLRPADRPRDPADQALFRYLPWESPSQGERLVTRQEIDWPFQLGPVKFVPYALGEAGHWGEDLNGDDVQRLYWQGGLRASIPFWSVDPGIQSSLLNVNGIAHKVVLEVEAAYSDSNIPLEEMPLYDPLDDNNIEAFRRRFAVYDFPLAQFPGGVPRQFDERFYAVRSGLGSWVSSPSFETVDDMFTIRVGLEQRWQTKRGIPGKQRIVDWIRFDTNLTFFPNADRDNLGTAAGLLDYDFRWQIGDRVSLLSSGLFDFFDMGQQIVTVGGLMNRPPNGSLYAGYRRIRGPIKSEVLLASYSYRMSPKWISTLGASVDIAGNGNIGESLSVTRIGESFLITLGANVDASRGTYGLFFAVEPRFLPGGRLGHVGGASIAPAGAFGLE